MRHLLYDLRFIARNWRYFHAHNALAAELRDWWNDYDQPSAGPWTDYSISVNTDLAKGYVLEELQRIRAGETP